MPPHAPPPDPPSDAAHALAAVPPGPWAVGVSGGADSVALLLLARRLPSLTLHAVHLDHQTRDGASTHDARFVAALCADVAVPCTTATRGDVESAARDLPANRSARFRALRLALFRQVCDRHGLTGVLLAHHAGDQAETVLQRLLRGVGPGGLGGIRPRARVGGLTILRPLLDVPPEALRQFLASAGRPWREDASNASPAYQRNRARRLLATRPALARSLRQTGAAMGDLSAWAAGTAPPLPDEFASRALATLPNALAAAAARRWLVARGAPPDDVSPAVVARLLAMARDAATPPRQHFPGGLLVARRAARISLASGGT
jgi:tRNA(Ile)-lysidine synthase